MSIAHIVAEKGSATVTIGADETLEGASRLLSRHRIGAVVIVAEDGGIEGILSERDVVRAVAEAGGAALAEPVGRHMSRGVATCAPTASITDLMTMMTNGKFRHVPVVDGGRLAGMVSIGDIVKHRLAEMEAEQNAMRSYIATA